MTDRLLHSLIVVTALTLFAATCKHEQGNPLQGVDTDNQQSSVRR